MKRLINSRLARVMGFTLAGTAALYGVTNSAPANASFFPQLEEFQCLADYSGKKLNCTANDIRVSQVTDVTNLDGSTPVECVLGEKVTFKADVTVETTANERYGYGIWLPEGNWSAQDQNPDNTCSVLIGDTNGPGVDIDGDVCADISKAAGFSPVHVYEDEVITLFCRDDDNSGKAEFNYCASWNQQEYGLCTETEPTPAGSPSKCRCESFDIDVFIKPEPPIITKTLVGTNTRPEPGGEYTFDVSFKNESKSSLFLTSLSDEVDEVNEGALYEYSLDLWGTPVIVTPSTPEGVYLTATSCVQPPDIGNGLGEIAPDATYSCRFTVHIVDADLPDLPATPTELYDDVVLTQLEDAKGQPVTNGETCPTGVGGSPGQFCSNKLTVEVTNLKPDISVTKTADPTFVLEPGGDVLFTIVVTNDAAVGENWDSPLTLTSLNDSDFGNLDGKGSCDLTSVTLVPQGTYTCSFTETITGDFGDPAHSNTVTAVATDNENDTDTATATATVDINDVESNIALIKTAGGEDDGVTHEVPETGDTGSFVDVVYKFEFSVDASSVDNVIFDKLEDLVDSITTDLTSQCLIDFAKGAVVDPPVALGGGYELAPGESASCEITLALQGNAGDTRMNVATIYGTDSDGADKQASDPADVLFVDVPLQITPQVAMKARVFVRLPNNGVDIATVHSVTIGSTNLVDGAGSIDGVTGRGFEIIDETAGTFGPYGEVGVVEGTYDFCAPGDTINPNEIYECGFTIKLFPGFATGLTDPDIESLFTGPDALKIFVDDGDGAGPQPLNDIELIFVTNEP